LEKKRKSEGRESALNKRVLPLSNILQLERLGGGRRVLLPELEDKKKNRGGSNSKREKTSKRARSTEKMTTEDKAPYFN